MRRLNSTDIAGVILAGVLIVGGLACVLYPREGAFGYDGSYPSWSSTVTQRTKVEVRICGAFALGFGIVLGALVLWKPRK